MSTFETRAEIVPSYRGDDQPANLDGSNTTNRNVHQSSAPVPKPRVFSKRIRKCHTAKRGDQSIAPLLETISALAVNSDLSGSEYEDYEEGIGGMHHEDDEDDVEDYDFEQEPADKQLRGEQTKSFANGQGDIIESRTKDLQQHMVEDLASSALPRVPAPRQTDLEPVNAFVVSEPFCGTLARATSSTVNRPRFELPTTKDKWSPKSGNGVHFASNPAGSKCVRFNADVQVTQVSPRMVHKLFNATGQGASGHQPHVHQFHRSPELSPRNAAEQDASEVSSNMYDEVASSASSQSPQLYQKNALEHLSVPANSRLPRDMSFAEVQRKFKKKQPSGEHDSPPQPLYSNLEMMQCESKSEAAKTNQTTHTTGHGNNPMPQQKSILKDPLCSKLRSAIRKGQFAMTDPAKLESEIDALLYGNESGKALTEGNNAELGADASAKAMGCQDKREMLAKVRSIGQLFTGKAYQPAAPATTTAAKSSPKKYNAPSRMATDSSTAPCNSYIQMIEEKYRTKESNLPAPPKSKISKVAKHTVKASESESKPKGIKSLNKQSTVTALTAMDSANLANYRPCPSPSAFDAPYLAHTSHQNMPMFSSTMDQLMSNIMQESNRSAAKEEPTKAIHENSVELQSGKPKKPARGKPPPAAATHQDSLYGLFDDPVKGPCINMLMDQLSRNFSSLSDTESIQSSTSTLSKSLVENHIYEEILYECLEKQGQLGSVMARQSLSGGQLDPALYLASNHQPTANGVNISSFMSSLTASNGVIDSSAGFSHKI